jgi:hypothetical protein
MAAGRSLVEFVIMMRDVASQRFLLAICHIRSCRILHRPWRRIS